MCGGLRQTPQIARPELCRCKNWISAIKKPKVIVADSLYGSHRFLAVFLKLKQTFALVRLRSNMVFYGPPKPYQKGQRGRPAKHGIKFRLSEPPRPADQQDTFQLREQLVRLQAWEGLHLKKLPDPVGMVLKVEFLRPDGTPRYIRPLWLFWTGPTTISLKALCLMYLWRFAIEHTFRFLKQHLGLNTNQSTDTICTDHWMWLCGLAYWQLLLMRDTVNDALPAWYPGQNDFWQQDFHARASPTGCFTIFDGFGHTGFIAQTCRKRQRQANRLSSSSPNPFSDR